MQPIVCPKCGHATVAEPEVVRGGQGSALRSGVWWWSSDRINAEGVMSVDDNRPAVPGYTFTRIADIPNFRK